MLKCTLVNAMKTKILILSLLIIVCLTIPFKQTISITNANTKTTYNIPTSSGDIILSTTNLTTEQLVVQDDKIFASNPKRQIDQLILFIGQNQTLSSNNAKINLQQLGATGQQLTLELQTASLADMLQTLFWLIL